MKPLRHDLGTTIRPRLMVVAARHALTEYRREVMLPRLLGLPSGAALPPEGAALRLLQMRETAMNDARKRHDASWRACDHVLVLAALMYENAALASSTSLFDHSPAKASAPLRQAG